MSAPASANVTVTLPDGKAMTCARGATGARCRGRHRAGAGQGGAGRRGERQDMGHFPPAGRRCGDPHHHRKDDAALELIRHDAAHVLAMAVQELYPGTQVTIGPTIEDGFYYDFARETPFTPDDLPKIEAKMHEIVKAGSADPPRSVAARQGDRAFRKASASTTRPN